MNQIDAGLETANEEFFRPEAIVVRLLLGLEGLSQDRLAELSKVGQNSISLYQRGKLVPSPETLDQLAQAAGWPLPAIEQMALTAVRIREHPRAFSSLQLDSTAVEFGRKAAVLFEAALLEIGSLPAPEDPDLVPSDPDRDSGDPNRDPDDAGTVRAAQTEIRSSRTKIRSSRSEIRTHRS